MNRRRPRPAPPSPYTPCPELDQWMHARQPQVVRPPRRIGGELYQLLQFASPVDLRDGQGLLHPAKVYDAIGGLRDGVTRRGSNFKIEGVGARRFEEILDWLTDAGYDVERFRLPHAREETAR